MSAWVATPVRHEMTETYTDEYSLAGLLEGEIGNLHAQVTLFVSYSERHMLRIRPQGCKPVRIVIPEKPHKVSETHHL